MELFPAIDVRGGAVARSGAGDPRDLARAWAAAGARWIHFVDMDRAYGTGDNRAIARALLGAAPLPVQVGGGLTAPTDLAELLAWGAARVVLGAAAATDLDRVGALLKRHGAERVAVGLDARDGHLAPRGSAERADVQVAELAERLHGAGVRTVVYTDVARDGRLAGPDLAGAAALAARGLGVIVSGGIASLDDLRAARRAGLAGAVVGRALHEGRFTLAEAVACLA